MRSSDHKELLVITIPIILVGILAGFLAYLGWTHPNAVAEYHPAVQFIWWKGIWALTIMSPGFILMALMIHIKLG